MKNVILVVDVGTQSARASIVDDEGNILVFESQKYAEPYKSPKNGYVEQDPNFYFDQFALCTKRIKEKNPELLAQCKSMAIAAFRDSACYLDENFKPLRDSILWLDQRSAKLKEKIPALYTFIFKVIGMQNTVIFNRKRTASHWIKENEPEVWAKCKYYAPLTSYWNYLLTGQYKDSEASAIGHYPINFKTGKWYGPKHIKGVIFGIKKEQLPELVKVGDVIGTITQEVSEKTGIPAGIKLIAAGTDKTSEVLGNGVLENDEASISYGTACCIDVPSRKYNEPEPFLPAYKAPIPRYYDMEVQVYRGYRMLTWFIKEFASDTDIKQAAIASTSIENIIDNKILDIDPGCNGLVLQPYWGPGLRRPLARGAIVGFSDVHTKYHMYRAIIEGIAFALKEGMIGIQKKNHKKVKRIVVSGGGSKNDVIAQITADLFDLPVWRCTTSESTTIGAAMSGFLAEGVFKTPEEAKAKMVHYANQFLPNKENAKKYDYLFKHVYLKMYPKLNGCYRAIKDFDNEEIL